MSFKNKLMKKYEEQRVSRITARKRDKLVKREQQAAYREEYQKAEMKELKVKARRDAKEKYSAASKTGKPRVSSVVSGFGKIGFDPSGRSGKKRKPRSIFD